MQTQLILKQPPHAIHIEHNPNPHHSENLKSNFRNIYGEETSNLHTAAS
jgi:hypothetical protein